MVDLGAGTGKLTRTLAALGHDVVAIEPLEEMLDQLRANVPGVEALPGSAERIPVVDESADVLVAGQAYHWFDPELALPEIARVLRIGAAFGLIWNMRDDKEPWLERLADVLGSETIDFGWSTGPIEESGFFGPIETATFRHDQELDRATLLDLVASRSHVATAAPDERAEILETVGRIYDEAATENGVVLPYVAYAFRATRL